MSEPVFYVPPENRTADFARLPDDEARHAIQVLRMSQGDPVAGTDGAGNVFTGSLVITGKKSGGIQIAETHFHEPPKPKLTVVLGLIKNRQRLEWAIEKMTECGVNEILLAHTERTERGKVRTDRLQSVAMSAMKQSRRADLPAIKTLDFNELTTLKPEHCNVFIAHEKQESSQSISYSEAAGMIAEGGTGKGVVMLIGPEGGFSESEVAFARNELNASLLWLGPRRLRAETAAVVISGLVRFFNSDSESGEEPPKRSGQTRSASRM